MKRIRIIRTIKGKNSTLSHLYLEQRFLSYLLEDRMSEKKEAGLTCIPEGSYELCLNTEAPMNVRYRQRFPTLHKGMLEVTGIPNFEGVFLHIGNSFTDTRGCPLTGHYWLKAGEDFQVCQSAFAYLQIYPILLSLLRKEGKCSLVVIDETEGGELWT